eukprot:scaffold142669_cov19-Prasinocladus_malaysianus.AAC.1
MNSNVIGRLAAARVHELLMKDLMQGLVDRPRQGNYTTALAPCFPGLCSKLKPLYGQYTCRACPDLKFQTSTGRLKCTSLIRSSYSRKSNPIECKPVKFRE